MAEMPSVMRPGTRTASATPALSLPRIIPMFAQCCGAGFPSRKET